jgi:flagellar motor switch protein FliM
LENTTIPFKVVMGKTVITVRDLLALSVGDVIPLNRNISQELDIVIGNRAKFLGKPGVFANRMAIQVTGIVEEESE